MNTPSTVTLSNDNFLELLKHFVNLGYKRTAAITVKQAARLSVLFRYLNKTTENPDPKLTEPIMYTEIFKSIDFFNANKGYHDIDEAFGIMSIVDHINGLLTPPAPQPTPAPTLEPSKIEEL